MTLEAALLALSTTEARLAAAEARTHTLEAERRLLSLRVQDLEQQLAVRRGGHPEHEAPAPATLGLFQELQQLAPVAPGTSERPSLADRPRVSPAERRPRGRKPLDPALPREEIRLPDPPEASRVDVFTGEPLMEGFTETVEVLACKPAVYFVKRYVRTVWVSVAKTAPVATPWPKDVLTRSGIHASVIAHIAAAHFSDHLPYHRLEQQLARTGVSLARSTQVSVMAQLDTLVAPVVEHIKRQVLASGYVHLDATPIDVCDRTRPGAAQSATLWAYRARHSNPAIEGLVWFDYRETKTPAEPAMVLREAKYRGIVQTDGAAGLDALGPPEVITHLGCWAHARKHVKEAVESGDRRAEGYLAQIRRLFRIDARVRALTARWSADDPRQTRIARWRARFSMPLVRQLFTRAATEVVALPPKTALASALGYLLNQRASLERCVTTPGAWLDNNGAENAIRPLKLGARNWLFIGHPDAGPRLAHLFTLVENCRQAKADPEAYLIDLLTALAAGPLAIAEWLPRSWKNRRAVGVTQ